MWRCVVSGRYRVQVRVVWVAKISESKNHHVCEQTAAMIGGDRYINMRRKKHEKYLKLMRCERGGRSLKKRDKLHNASKQASKNEIENERRKKKRKGAGLCATSLGRESKKQFFYMEIGVGFFFHHHQGG